MRKYWSKEEEEKLKYYYEKMGLSVSEFYEKFDRTKTSLEVKIGKLKLKHTEKQKSKIKSRLNSGEKNGMYNKIGPNKGLNKDNSKRILNASKKISKTRKKLYQDGILDTSGEKNGMYGKEPWNKGETKYNNKKIKDAAKKISVSRKRWWDDLSQDDKDKIIGNLSLAANKAKKDTKIEIIIKRSLDKMNILYIKNYKQGRFIFDFYLPDNNFIIECQGDYWHGNPKIYKTLNEIQIKNKIRDKNKIEYLKKNKINSLFLWENEIYKNKEILEKIILEKINETY